MDPIQINFVVGRFILHKDPVDFYFLIMWYLFILWNLGGIMGGSIAWLIKKNKCLEKHNGYPWNNAFQNVYPLYEHDYTW
jgi:hypothetical protein